MRPAADTSPAPRASPEAALEDQKRSFLRMVSHELRTPLNSILGFSEILASELYGPLGAPQYKEYAEIVRDSGYPAGGVAILLATNEAAAPLIDDPRVRVITFTGSTRTPRRRTSCACTT